MEVNKAIETASVVLCLPRPPAASLTKQSLQISFIITTMDQLDHYAGLQGTPHKLPIGVLRNLRSLGFSSPDVPADNMYQTNWGTNESPTSSLGPIDEGSSPLPAAAKHLADILLIFASCIQCECVEYASRDTFRYSHLIPSGSVGP